MRSRLAALTLLLALAAPAAALELVSHSPGGQVGTERSDSPSMSADGRFVTFMSRSTNLLGDVSACSLQIQGDTLYVRDTVTGALEVLGGAILLSSTAMSASGRHVAYFCGGSDVCIRDRIASTTTQLSVGAYQYDSLTLSADGRFLAYATSAQVHVYDTCLSDGESVLSCTAGASIVSVNNSGVPGNQPSGTDSYRPDMTPDGRYVVFASEATNLVPGTTSGNNTYVRDRCVTTSGPVLGCTASTRRVNVAEDGSTPTGYCSLSASISDDGRYVAMESCTSLVAGSVADVYVRDRDLDANGVFDEAGPGKTKTEVVDQTTAGVPGDNSSGQPQISGDGRYVAFQSHAFNLSGGDCADYGCDDVYVRDTVDDTLERISESPAGEPSYTDPYPGGTIFGSVGISGDGHRVIFATYGNNLADHDDNGRPDVFVWTDCAAAAPVCGNSSTYAGCETCDDGNMTSDDGCDYPSCRVTGCGSGVVTGSEVCDDGNRIEGDGCDSNCTVSACGNGVRAELEGCDDGNMTAGDACSPTCELENLSYIPGGGKKDTDCWHEWRTEPPVLPNPLGLPKRELKCTDDDPSCDFGGATGDNACTFHIQMCFNVLDSRVAPCAPTEIETIRLTKPKQWDPKDAVEIAIRDQFEAIFDDFEACVGGSCSRPPSMVNVLCVDNVDCDDTEPGEGVCKGRFAALLDIIDVNETNVCGDTMNIVVPLTLRNGEYVKTRRSLALKTEPTPDPVTFRLRQGDSDMLTLICLPQP
jgi:cysteine-rich repeat protein